MRGSPSLSVSLATFQYNGDKNVLQIQCFSPTYKRRTSNLNNPTELSTSTTILQVLQSRAN
jgi:hypothetical protein